MRFSARFCGFLGDFREGDQAGKNPLLWCATNMNENEWNYARDGSLASRHRPAGAGVKPPGAAAFRKGVVVSDHGKGVLKASGVS